MDKLDRLIADKEAEIEHLEKRIKEQSALRERLIIQLETLKQAAELRPVAEPKKENEPSTAWGTVFPPVGNGANRPKKSGRQTGDIAVEWRNVLSAIWQTGRKVSFGDFHKLAKAAGIDCEIANVRGRVRHFAKMGFVSGSAEEGFLVTTAAAERFDFAKRKAPAEDYSAGASH